MSIDAIQEFANRLVDEFEPEKIILFGSYATGAAAGHSDVDLLVIMPFAGEALRQEISILECLKPRFSVDLIVKTPETVRERLALHDFFLKDIMETGKVLYEAAHV